MLHCHDHFNNRTLGSRVQSLVSIPHGSIFFSIFGTGCDTSNVSFSLVDLSQNIEHRHAACCHYCCLMYHKCFFCCHPSELLLISTIATAITSSPHVASNHLDSAHHGILCPPCVVLCFLLSNTSLFFCVPSVRQLCSLAKLLSSTICLITCLHPTVTLPARYVTGSDTPLASSGKKCETLINKSYIL